MFLIKGPHPLGGLRGWGQKVKIQFSEYGHDAYQIKRNLVYSGVEANILPAGPPLPPTPQPWVISSNSLFIKTWSCCISN